MAPRPAYGTAAAQEGAALEQRRPRLSGTAEPGGDAGTTATWSADGQVKRVVVRLLANHRDRVGAAAECCGATDVHMLDRAGALDLQGRLVEIRQLRDAGDGELGLEVRANCEPVAAGI